MEGNLPSPAPLVNPGRTMLRDFSFTDPRANFQQVSAIQGSSRTMMLTPEVYFVQVVYFVLLVVFFLRGYLLNSKFFSESNVTR